MTFNSCLFYVGCVVCRMTGLLNSCGALGFVAILFTTFLLRTQLNYPCNSKKKNNVGAEKGLVPFLVAVLISSEYNRYSHQFETFSGHWLSVPGKKNQRKDDSAHVLSAVYFPKHLLLAIFRKRTLSWWILWLSQYGITYISLSRFPQFFHYFLFFLFYKLIVFVQECHGADENPLSRGHLRPQDVLGTITNIFLSLPCLLPLLVITAHSMTNFTAAIKRVISGLS